MRLTSGRDAGQVKTDLVIPAGTVGILANQNSPYVTSREQAVVEAWSQGFNVGAIVILILLVLCNYRRKTLLHKLILGEV